MFLYIARNTEMLSVDNLLVVIFFFLFGVCAAFVWHVLVTFYSVLALLSLRSCGNILKILVYAFLLIGFPVLSYLFIVSFSK